MERRGEVEVALLVDEVKVSECGGSGVVNDAAQSFTGRELWARVRGSYYAIVSAKAASSLSRSVSKPLDYLPQVFTECILTTTPDHCSAHLVLIVAAIGAIEEAWDDDALRF